jgi:preprotein translocase subunit SecE
MGKLKKFIKEAFGELKRVAWPTREEVIYLTLLVISVCLGLGLFFAGIDFLFTQFINLIL